MKEKRHSQQGTREEGKGPVVESLGSYLCTQWLTLSEIFKTSVAPFSSVIWRYIGDKFQVLVEH